MFEGLWKFASDSPGVLAAVAAAAAVVTAFISILVSIYALYVQRLHNKASVRPILDIEPADYENDISVSLRNSGVGPLTILAITVKNRETNRVTESVIEQMSGIGVPEWDTFVEHVKGKTIGVSNKIVLLRLVGDDENPGYTKSRDEVREALAKLEVKVSFCDVYKNSFGPQCRMLDWFGRHAKADKFKKQ